MKILLDSAMPYWRELFKEIATVTTFNAGDLDLSDKNIQFTSLKPRLKEVEYLLVRSTTRVSSDLIDLMPNLRFVGTATAGFDHLDTDALQQRGIIWYAAAGCNAQAVCQYIVSTVLVLASVDKFKIAEKTIAIVGFGQVGSRVALAMTALGAKVKIYDPPLEKRYLQTKNSASSADFWESQPLGCKAQQIVELHSGFVSFEHAIKADIICLHSPLNQSAEFNNYHLFDQKALLLLNKNQYLINAGRGELIDNKALLRLFEIGNKNMPSVVLDVWEHEPFILSSLIPFIRIATPHIAGHSLEGKAKGTFMLYQKLCELENMNLEVRFDNLIPSFNVNIPKRLIERLLSNTDIDSTNDLVKLQSDLLSLCSLVYLVENDDRVFRQHMAQSASIAKLRQSYPIRREFSAVKINGLNNKTNELLSKIGFIISNDSNTTHIG